MKLYYRECGKGQPMILLHGNGEDSTYFENQIRFFSKKYRVIAIDTRGHGKSPRGTRPFTVEQFAKDLKGFLDEKRLRHIILLGFSDGGNVALTFSLRYPEYVDRLILNGANLNPLGVKAATQIPITVGYGFCLACKAASQFGRMLTEIAAVPSGRKKKRKTVKRKDTPGQIAGAVPLQRQPSPERQSCKKEQYKGSLEQKTELLGLMVKGPWIEPEELKRLKMPVLVIAGTKDMIRNGHTRRIYYGIPDSRLRLIAGHHFIASEKSFEFNRAVAAILHATEGSKVKTMKRLWADRHPGRLDQEMGFDSAVLVPLLEKDGEYHLLFEVRAGVLKCQPGEVCFPGGAVEKGETRKEAAVRETMEELGVYKSQIDLVAPLDILITPANLGVYPFLAELKGYKGTFSGDEVDHVFTVPLKWFLEREPECYDTDVQTIPGKDFPFDLIPGGEDYHWRRGRYKVMFYRYGENVIWGMTAKILHSFVEMYREDFRA